MQCAFRCVRNRLHVAFIHWCVFVRNVGVFSASIVAVWIRIFAVCIQGVGAGRQRIGIVRIVGMGQSGGTLRISSILRIAGMLIVRIASGLLHIGIRRSGIRWLRHRRCRGHHCTIICKTSLNCNPCNFFSTLCWCCGAIWACDGRLTTITGISQLIVGFEHHRIVGRARSHTVYNDENNSRTK